MTRIRRLACAVCVSLAALTGPLRAQETREFFLSCVAELRMPRTPLPNNRALPIEYLTPVSVNLTFYLDPQESQARVSTQLFTLREGSSYRLIATPQAYIVERDGADFVEALRVTVVREVFTIDRVGSQLRHTMLLSDGRELGQVVRSGRCRRNTGRL